MHALDDQNRPRRTLHGPCDETLLRALESTLDRIAHYLDIEDEMMASVVGGVVGILLNAPGTAMCAADVRWRRQLTRWDQLKRRIGAPPAAMADFVVDRARLYLLEAARAAGATP